jgi:hypothetical protein
MSQSLKVLVILAAVAASTPALAQSGEQDAQYYSGQPSFSAFEYHPIRVQIEGGPTFPAGMTGHDLQSGTNVGGGLTWQPTSHLPLALRVDGMYEQFDERSALLTQAAASLGTTVDWGHTEMWGGDVDAELDTMLSPWVRLYLLAGAGGYDRRDRYYQRQVVNGVICGWFFCEQGSFLTSVRVGESQTGMRFEENAGAGLEFPIGGRASLFVDARYMRFNWHGQKAYYVPLRVGLRF